MLSVKRKSASTIFEVFGMTRPASNLQNPGHKAGAVPTEALCRFLAS